MDTYGGYLLSTYGGICWVITEDLFLIYLLIPIRMIKKNIPQFFWVRRKIYSTDISDKCHVSGPKDKHPPWYQIYKLLNENWIFCTKAFNKMAKNIMQFSSQKFGSSPHFIKAIFIVYSFLLFSCSVIYFIAIIIGYKLGLAIITKYPDYRPRRRYSSKNYRIGFRYKNNWGFKKKRCQNKNKKKNLKYPISLLSVFTSVLNVDEHCWSRDRLHYDIDSVTMVCDNSANFSIYNQRNMFVGEIRKVSNKKVATTGVK